MGCDTGGYLPIERKSQELSIERLKLQNKYLEKKNMRLEIDLIKLGISDNWELNGDNLGNWWYEKTDCGSLGECSERFITGSYYK